METRTLAQFRAEQNIWRKDLAAQLGVSEGEIDRLETLGTVPQPIAAQLIAAYSLPANYFTEDLTEVRAAARAAARYTPKHPLAYFFVVSLVWQLLVELVCVVVQAPLFLTGTADNTAARTLLVQICLLAVQVFSGIYLGAHLLKKTNFRGKVADFEFLYPLLPGATVLWVKQGLTKILFGGMEGSTQVLQNWIATEAVEIIALVLSSVFLAFFLQAAVESDAQKRGKYLKILCGVTLGGNVLSHIFSAVFRGASDMDVYSWICTIASIVLLVAVLFGVAFGAEKKPSLQKLWYVGLPIACMVLPTALSLVFGLL